MGDGPSSSRIALLRERVREDPFDARSWDELIEALQLQRRKTPEETAELRQAYEDLLAQFPTAVRGAACMRRCRRAWR